MNTRLNIRTDVETKEKAKKYFKEMGVSMSKGINILLKHAIEEEGVEGGCMICRKMGRAVNKETLKAIRDVDNGIGISKPYTSLEEMWKDLGI